MLTDEDLNECWGYFRDRRMLQSTRR